MALRIEDYAMIGNTRTAALVGNNGSVDWLCVPRFDSPTCFAALLGDENNGRWLIAPEGEAKAVRRRYRDDTLILETEFETETGIAAVIDFMPRPSHDDQVDIVRIVEGRRGTVPMRTELVVRFDYGSIVPWVRRREYGLRAVAGPDAIRFQSPVVLENRDLRSTARFEIGAGQSLSFRLTWFPSHADGPVVGEADRELAECEDWWHDWAAQCTYEGEWRDAVIRSLIVLKALTYAPTGGIVAAPTTSLPEALGGPRNWDYRYCWIRDATLTLDALASSGFLAEARAWRDWLLRAVAGTPSQMQIMYSVTGERRLAEYELPWLDGYEGSRPVRVGNGAHRQLQLDVYGEIMDSFYLDRVHHLRPSTDGWEVQKALLETLEAAWQRPDNGLWEMRGPPRHFTHSKVMCWVAADRAVKSVEGYGLEGPVDRWRALRDRIHDDVCRNGFDATRNAFVQYYGGEALDAAALMIPLVGFLPADDPRVIGTVEAIRRELVVDGLVRRYSPTPEVDGLQGDEGGFLACSFWLADALCLTGQRAEARELFERLLAMRNDLGLLAEEYDPRAGRQLGNFPQAFSHIGLITTAHNLSSRRGPAERRAERGKPTAGAPDGERSAKAGSKLRRALAMLSPAALSGCSLAATGVLDPHGPVGMAERNLLLTATGLMLVVAIPVFVLTFWFAWRYRASNPRAAYLPDWSYSARLDVVVWLVPACIVAILGYLVWTGTHRLDPYKAVDSALRPLNVEVVAEDWKWLFLYPEQQIATVNELVFPAGRPLRLTLTSDTVMNSFFIPGLGGQIYAMPGMRTELNLLSDAPASFVGMNTQYSGDGFADQHFAARAVTEADFTAWREAVRRSPETLDAAAYAELAQPGLAPAPVHYSGFAPSLFDSIVASYAGAPVAAAQDGPLAKSTADP